MAAGSAGPAEYLPPLVTKFLADTSELTKAFGDLKDETKAWGKDVSVVLAEDFGAAGAAGANHFKDEVDRGLKDWQVNVVQHTKETANKQTKTYADEVEKGIDKDVAPKAVKAAAGMGIEVGKALSGGFSSIVSGVVSNPFGLAAVIAIGLVAAVPVAASIGSLVGLALVAGVGAAFIGLGALILKDEPKIVKAAQNLSKTVDRVFTQAAKSMAGPFETAIYMIENAVNRLAGPLTTAFQEMSVAIIPLVNGFIGLVENAMPGLLAALPVAAQLLTQLGTLLPGLGEDISYFFSKLAEGGPQFATALEILIKSIGRFIRISADVIVWLAKVYVWLHELTTGVHKWATETGSDIADWAAGVGRWFEMVGDKIVGWYNTAKTWIVNFAKEIGDWFSSAGDSVSTWIDGVVKWFSELPNKIWEWLTELPEIFAKAFWAAFDQFFYIAGYVVTAVGKFFAELPGKIFRSLVDLRNYIITTWRDILVWTLQLGVDLWNWAQKTWSDVVAWFARLGDDLAAWAQALPMRIVVWFASTYHSIVNWVTRTYNDVIAWFSRLPDAIAGWLHSMFVRIASWAAGAIGWLRQAGVDIVQGLINGVTSKIEDAIGAVKRAMQRFIQGANDALGNRSPSKVFAKIGQYTIDGLIVGITENAPRAAKAWGQLLAPAGASFPITAGRQLSSAMLADGSGGRSGPVIVVQAGDTYLDGKLISLGLIPHAQRTKQRTGTSGLS